MLFSIIVCIALLLFFFGAYLLRGQKILLVVFIIAYTVTIKSFIVQAYKIPAGSMLPTIFVGDHILTNKYIYKIADPTRGDLVIFPFPNDPNVDYIKRVIAVGGDTLEIIDKAVYVNGKEINEPYAMHLQSVTMSAERGPRDNYGPVTVPEQSLFVMGDNRDNSADSRYWGFVKRDTVKAKVELIYWSWDKETEQVRWNRIGKTIKSTES